MYIPVALCCYKQKLYRNVYPLIVFAFCTISVYAFEIPDTTGVTSFEQLKFTGVHEQGADKSCGLSVVSSVLNLYLGHKATEAVLIDEFRADLQQNKEVSIAQMVHIFTAYGYNSKVYKTNTANLIKAVQLYAPVIGY